MIVVSDSSVLSALAAIGELDLLPKLFGKITVTATICREAGHRNAPQGLRELFSSIPSWLEVVPDPSPYLEETTTLDPGEASAITLVWQNRPASLLILDEKRGRKVASALGLKITGTAGLMMEAAATGLIDFDDALARLSQVGFRLGSHVSATLRQSLAKRTGQ